MAVLRRPPTTFVHDLASRLRCSKCAKAGRRPGATLLQLARRARHPDLGRTVAVRTQGFAEAPRLSMERRQRRSAEVLAHRRLQTALDDELTFLRTEIYLRDVERRLQTLTAFTRFSSRV
ncbi:hypothetical protein ABIB75_001070 [Bradyrhizobium sp. GM2.2]